MQRETTAQLEAMVPDTKGGEAEAPADGKQRCDKRQHNNQPEDKRDVARDGGATRGGGLQQLGVWACCWHRKRGSRRWPLLLKWRGAQELETVPNADVDNYVQLSSAMW